MFGAALDNIRSALGPAMARVRRMAAVAPNPAFGLLLLAIAAYTGYFTYYALSHLDLVSMFQGFNIDDSFYYYQIARNMAEGQFSTFDGGITRTNGYHPVWMLLITPFYWMLDRETALFGIKAFELALLGGSAAVLALSARLCRLPWVALVAVLPLLYQQKVLWVGMEASAGLFALSLLFLALSLVARNAGRWWPLLAAVSFLLPWVRLEYLAIALAATAGAGIVVWMQSGADVGAARRRGWGGYRIRLPGLPVWGPLLTAGLGGALYFAYNRLVFGGYVPVSGVVKQTWSQGLFERDGGFELAANLAAHWQDPVFGEGLPIAVEVCVYAGIVWWASRRASHSSHPLLSLFLVGAAALALGHTAKFAQHALTMHPVYNADWYFVPAYLLMALIIPLRCFTAVYLIKVWVSPRWPGIGRALTGAAVATAVIAAAATAGFAQPFKAIDNMPSNAGLYWERSGYLGAQVMNRILPDDAVVGSWDAGIIGYFADFPVVNLDGLVNSYEHYRQYIRNGWGNSTRVEQRYGITHFANLRGSGEHRANTLFVGTGFPEREQQEQEVKDAAGVDFTDLLPPPAGESEFAIWLSEPDAAATDPAPAEQLRTMLQEQADYYSGDGAALVVSNLVHTFAFDCGPGRTDALALVVDGDFPDAADNKYGNKLTYFWGDLRRNYLGYCVEAFELPNATGHPVAVTVAPFATAVNELLRGQTPLVQSDWEVYRIGRQLLYHRADCAPADTATPFQVHLIPADAGDLSGDQRKGGYYGRAFEFDAAGGVRSAGRCLVRAPVPDYEIIGIRTGQFTPETGWLWDSAFYTESYRAARAARVDELAASAAGEPIVRDYYDVYHGDGALTYVKEDCTPTDTKAAFYLHLTPADADVLPEAQRDYGLDNRDFEFVWQGGVQHAGRCLVSVPLPGYEIHGIHTGQYAADVGRVWRGEFYTESYYAALASELAARAAANPAAQDFYSVYHDAGALTYVREDCVPADTAAAFYLHLIPSDAAVLPAEQREHGFDNRDFEFEPAGGVQYDGRCLVSIPLPDYAIGSIRTGQYAPDAGRLWSVEFAVGE